MTQAPKITPIACSMCGSEGLWLYACPGDLCGSGPVCIGCTVKVPLACKDCNTHTVPLFSYQPAPWVSPSGGRFLFRYDTVTLCQPCIDKR